MPTVASVQAAMSKEMRATFRKHVDELQAGLAEEGKTNNGCVLEATAAVLASVLWHVVKLQAVKGAPVSDLIDLYEHYLVIAAKAVVKVDLENPGRQQ